MLRGFLLFLGLLFALQASANEPPCILRHLDLNGPGGIGWEAGEKAKAWLWGLGDNSEFQRELESVDKLSPEQRVQLLQKVKKAPSGNRYRVLMELAAYSETRWEEMYPLVAIHATSSGMDQAIFRKWLEEMPWDLKDKILARVEKEYLQANKFSSEPQGSEFATRLGPKRGMDAFLTIVTRPGEEFEKSIEKGMKPVEAYREVFKKMQKRVAADRVKGAFSFDEAMETYRSIQREFHRSVFPIDSKDDFFLLGGSFVNGKAIPGSDVDVIAQGFKDPSVQGKILRGHVFPGDGVAERRIDYYLGEQKGRKVDTKIEPIPGFIISPDKMGQNNAFQVKITPSTIELWVYPKPQFKGDKPAPHIYPLE